jgi:subtilisin family serine protease
MQLKWNDPWGTSNNNYDLIMFYDIDGDSYLEYPNEVVAYSAYNQNGTGGDDYPVEGFSYIAAYTGLYFITIGKASGSAKTLHLYSSHELYYQVAAGSLCVPADSPNAMTVGAVFWNTPDTIESFSSQGPTDAGLTKPDLVSYDGVSSSTYGTSNGGTWNSGGTGFFGTSASTPHATGAAALIKQHFPSYTPSQIQALLESRADPLGDTGKDNIYGSGRLYLGESETPPPCFLKLGSSRSGDSQFS